MREHYQAVKLMENIKFYQIALFCVVRKQYGLVWQLRGHGERNAIDPHWIELL